MASRVQQNVHMKAVYQEGTKKLVPCIEYIHLIQHVVNIRTEQQI